MNSTTIGVANANFVTPRLAVGGDLGMHNTTLATQQVVDLVDGGITHILDVRHESCDESVWQQVPHLTYRWEGIHDAGQRVPVAWFDTVVSWALRVLEDPDAKLLTHCHMGINRGPSAGYAVMLGLGWDPVDALGAIRSARPIAYIAYAEDALRWHHWRTGASPEGCRHDFARVAQWRSDNGLDIAKVIRRIRTKEAR